MNQLFEKLTARASKARLSPEEKAALRMRLLSFMDEYPVREGGLLRLVKRPVEAFSFYTLIPNKSMIGLVIAVLIAIGGGTSYAAEGALPGEALYQVKVHINEPIRAAVTASAEGKATWEAKLVERRLEEGAELSAQAEHKAEVGAKLNERFEAQAKKAEARVLKLEAEGKVEQAARLNAKLDITLKAHENILVRLNAESEADRDDRKKKQDALIEKVKVRIQQQESLKAKIEGDDKNTNDEKERNEAGVRTETAANVRLNLTARVIADTRAFIEKHKASLSTEMIARAEARLKLAEETFVRGKAELVAKNFKEAIVLFQDAATIARETRVAVKLLIKTNLEVRIPSQPTEEPDEDEKKPVKPGVVHRLETLLDTQLEASPRDDEKGPSDRESDKEKSGVSADAETESEVRVEVKKIPDIGTELKSEESLKARIDL